MSLGDIDDYGLQVQIQRILIKVQLQSGLYQDVFAITHNVRNSLPRIIQCCIRDICFEPSPFRNPIDLYLGSASRWRYSRFIT